MLSNEPRRYLDTPALPKQTPERLVWISKLDYHINKIRTPEDIVREIYNLRE
jgi:hypothetical protein